MRNYQVGDIVYYMYRYSSTFPVFFKVTKVSDKSVWVTEVDKAHTNITPGYASYDCSPVPEREIGRNRRVSIRPNGYAYIKAYYTERLEPWDGTVISGYSD